MIQNLQIITPGHPSVSPQQPEQFLSTVSFRLTIGWPMKTSSSASPQPVIYDRFPPLSGWSLCRPIHRYRPPGIPSTIKYFLRYLFQSLFFQFIFQHLLQFRGRSTGSIHRHDITFFVKNHKPRDSRNLIIFGNLAPTAGQ